MLCHRRQFVKRARVKHAQGFAPNSLGHGRLIFERATRRDRLRQLGKDRAEVGSPVTAPRKSLIWRNIAWSAAMIEAMRSAQAWIMLPRCPRHHPH
jgi:hypothetical protein